MTIIISPQNDYLPFIFNSSFQGFAMIKYLVGLFNMHGFDNTYQFNETWALPIAAYK
jgi:hypothetical protein